MFQCPNRNNRIHFSILVFPQFMKEMTLIVKVCQCTGIVSVSVCLSPPSAKKQTKKMLHRNQNDSTSLVWKLPGGSALSATNFTRVLPCPPLSLNYWLCNHKCTKDDGYAWPAAKCSRKNSHLFFFLRPVDLFCLKPLRVRNDIETLLSPQHREIDDNVTSLLKSLDT